MQIDKNKILSTLQKDLRAAEIIKKQWDGQRDEWLRESRGDPYGNEVDGKSKIVSKDIRKQLEWLIPSISDPFLSSNNVIKCNPITYEDVFAAEQNELLLNTQFCRKFPRFNFINKAIRVLAMEGTLVIQTGWDYEDEEVEEETEVVKRDLDGRQFVTWETTKVTKVTKNQPTAVVCRNEDIYLDPTCMDDIDKCQFVIHRYETDLSTLKADGRYKNLDRVAQMSTRDDTTFIPKDTTRFNFEDQARKKMVVYEYWGNYDVNEDGYAEPIVCAWIGNVIIRLEDNPYPDQKPPFIIVPFNAVPFQMYGEALAENIGDNQKVKTAITRGIIDNMARSNNGQIGIRRNALDMANRKKFLQGKNFEFNGAPTDFWQGSYNQIPGSVFDMLNMQNNEIEAQTGVKSFSGGINGNTLGATATAARGAMDATAMRRLHLVRNIAENLMKPLMRKWMSYNAEFMSEEEVIRVTNEKYVPVKRDDLAGDIDIDITISTQEDNSARAQELGFLLQTLGNTVPFDLTKLVLAEIVGLSRMPDLQKQLKEFEPKQDPAQEEMKQLEMQYKKLEIEKLRSEIAKNNARAGEDQIDVTLKQQKVAVEAAKARKLGSEADGMDLAFLMKNAGVEQHAATQSAAQKSEDDKARHMQAMDLQMVKHQSDMSKQEHKRLSDLDREALKQIGQAHVLANKETNKTAK